MKVKPSRVRRSVNRQCVSCLLLTIDPACPLHRPLPDGHRRRHEVEPDRPAGTARDAARREGDVARARPASKITAASSPDPVAPTTSPDRLSVMSTRPDAESTCWAKATVDAALAHEAPLLHATARGGPGVEGQRQAHGGRAVDVGRRAPAPCKGPRRRGTPYRAASRAPARRGRRGRGTRRPAAGGPAARRLGGTVSGGAAAAAGASGGADGRRRRRLHHGAGMGDDPGGSTGVPCGVGRPIAVPRARRAGGAGWIAGCSGCAARLDQRRRPAAEARVLARADVDRRHVVGRQPVRPDDPRRQQHDDVGLRDLVVVGREELLEDRHVDRAREPARASAARRRAAGRRAGSTRRRAAASWS